MVHRHRLELWCQGQCSRKFRHRREFCPKWDEGWKKCWLQTESCWRRRQVRNGIDIVERRSRLTLGHIDPMK
jgi:hypothetical protein